MKEGCVPDKEAALVASDLPEQSLTPRVLESQGQDHAQPVQQGEGFLSTSTQLELSFAPRAMVIGEDQQVGGETFAVPTGEASPSLDVD